MTAVERSFEQQLDELKIITLTDGEIWSARDLMPYAGYTNWRKWSGAIDRAIASVNASGLDASDHFVGGVKMVEVGSGARREVEDIELTRYACYILFQNADPRKPEVAAAQAYFAVQTRRQEIAAPTAPKGAELLALAVLEAQQMLATKDAQIAELEPRAGAWDDLASAEGDYSVADAAKMLCRAGIDTGRDRLFRTLQEIGWLYRQSGRLQARQRVVDRGYLRHKAQSHRHPDTDEIIVDAPQVRVTVKGIERLRIRMLEPIPELTG